MLIKPTKHTKIFLYFLFLYPTFLLAQFEPYYFESIHGQYADAPHSYVHEIYEDHTGFLWFGTDEGLFRFDGYEFLAFRHDVLDSTTISDPVVRQIREDKQGNLWIGTNTGLNRLDRNTKKITRFYSNPEALKEGKKEQNNVNGILEDDENRLWVATSSGLRLFDRAQQAFTLVPNIADSSSVEWVHCIHKTKTGKIFAGGRTGFWKVNPEDSTLEKIPLPDWGNSSIVQIEEDENGTLWMNTYQGLIKWNVQTSTMSKPALPDSLDNYLGCLFLDGQKIWLSDFLKEVTVFDIEKGTYRQLPYDPIRPNTLKEDFVTAFYKDQQGNLWIGGNMGIGRIIVDTKGVEHLLNEEGIQNRYNNVTNITENTEGYIFASTPARVFRHNPDRSEILEIPFRLSEEDLLLSCRTMSVDNENTLWGSLVNSKGVGIFRCPEGQTFLEQVPLGDTIGRILTSVILPDLTKDSILWLGNYWGLCQLNKRTLARTWFFPKKDLPDLPFNAVRYLAQEDETTFWMYYLAASALGRFDLTTGTFSIVRPPPHMAHTLEGSLEDFAIDANKNLWIATSFGLTRFDISTQQFHFYTKEDGLPENKLKGILPDQTGNLWVISNSYLTQMRLKDSSFQHFNLRNSIRRSTKANYLSPGGQILVGGTNGIYRLNPSKLALNPDPPKVILTDFKVLDKSYSLNQAPEDVENIQITYRDNIITFEFVALHFKEPKHNQYRCKLEGFDESWRDLGTERKITYTNLAPENYTFNVIAANSDGVWTKKGLEIQLTVTPAFWQTTWFKIVIAMVVFLLGFAIYKTREHQILLRQQKEIAEQSNEFKSRFLANISHEIRTPMNAIIGLSKLMNDDRLTDKQTEYNRGIRQSSENLLAIINDLLDHSKIESGKFTFIQQPFDLDASLRQLHNTLIFKAKEKGLYFSTHFDKQVPHRLIGDAVRLNQVLMNLVGNAIKFTEKGRVEVRVQKVEEIRENIKLSFAVQDTGVGIAQDKLEVIFESFQQADEDTFVKYGGTGLGLSISKELIEQQGGQLEIESEQGVGTTMTFYLIFKKATLLPDMATIPELRSPLENLRILLVEDTYFNQMLAEALLKKQFPDIQIDIAENGKIALEKVATHKYDLILMDVKMPVMNGHEATRIIRKMPSPICDIPILGLTANAVPQQLKACKDAGMNDTVTKPIDGKKLFEKIQEVVRSE